MGSSNDMCALNTKHSKASVNQSLHTSNASWKNTSTYLESALRCLTGSVIGWVIMLRSWILIPRRSMSTPSDSHYNLASSLDCKGQRKLSIFWRSFSSMALALQIRHVDAGDMQFV